MSTCWLMLEQAGGGASLGKSIWRLLNEISFVGTFILTIVIVVIMLKPPQVATGSSTTDQGRKSAEEVRKDRPVTGWIMPSLLCVSLLGAGFFHYKAAQMARSAPNVSLPPVHPPLPPSVPKAPIELTPPNAIAQMTSGRVMANATAEELAAIYSNHTTLQAEKLSECYMGTWLLVSGSVFNVDSRKDGMSVTLHKVKGVALVFCSFKENGDSGAQFLRKTMKSPLSDKFGNLTVMASLWKSANLLRPQRVP
jgi:hypothetical protein